MSSRETLEINNVYIFTDSGCLMREKEEMSLIELICGETISDTNYYSKQRNFICCRTCPEGIFNTRLYHQKAFRKKSFKWVTWSGVLIHHLQILDVMTMNTSQNVQQKFGSLRVWRAHIWIQPLKSTSLGCLLQICPS